jgi:AraC-like DNA-binding protein
VTRFSLKTRDLAQAHRTLSEIYVEHEPQFRGHLHGARPFHLDSVTAGDVGVDRLSLPIESRMVLDPFADGVIDVLLEPVVMKVGREELRIAAGEPFLFPLGVSINIQAVSMEALVVRFCHAHVAEVAAARGADPRDFRFTATGAGSPELARYWRATVTHLGEVLRRPGYPVENALVQRQLLDQAAAAALAVFPNTATHLPHQAPAGPVRSAAIRRAVAYLDDHAAEPLTVASVAAACGLSVRALQEGFRRHLDQTPMAYLRRVRIHHAHRDLQSAQPAHGDTVSAVAARWGFTATGRFAASYRDVYGCPPSETLRA